MKKTGLIFQTFIGIALLYGLASSSAGYFATLAWAKPNQTDLKSDLELEIEGRHPEADSQSESEEKPLEVKPVPKPKAPVVLKVTQKPQRKAEPPAPAAPIEPVKPAPEPVLPAVKVTPPDRSDEIKSRIEQARVFYKQKKYDQVVRILLPVNDALTRSGLLLLAKAYNAQSDILNELRTLELCIAKNPKDYVAQTTYGLALLRSKGRSEDGLAALQEARKLNPRYRPAYDALVAELERKGERYEARNVVTDMVNIFGPKPAFFTLLCRLYALDGFNEKSVEICDQAIANDPKTPENHVYLSQALVERDQADRAKSVLTHAASRFPASQPVQTALGDMYLNNKDYARAYEYYKKASAADGQAPRAWVGYANAAFQLQKNQEAITAYVKACKLDRQETKDFRLAIGALRSRKDVLWQSRFENGINECQ